MSTVFENIRFEEKGATALITINRPQVYNALTKAAKLEIVKAIREANKAPGLRSIVLAAEGKAFCTGQDLNDRTVQASSGEKPDLGNTLESEWNPLVNAIRNSKIPVIAAVQGVVAGAGVSVALACDLIVASPKVKFVSGFTRLGLTPDAGSSFVLGRALGHQKALEFFLLGEPLLSEDLHAAGLINTISDSPLDNALAWATKINGLSPKSTALVKRNLQKAYESTYDESIQTETAAQRYLGNSEEYQEGLKAFFEKREPKFH
ncbi:MAG: enoyl-CoA hydratase/isomerase family protein [bacterium]